MNRRNLYLIEDDVLTIQSLTLTLEQEGYHVCGSARSGEQALIEIPALHPDLVIIDVNLKHGGGQMDGIEVARQLDQVCPVPYVILTAQKDRLTFQQAMETNAYTRVSKPFNDSDLIFAVSKALKASTPASVGDLPDFLLVKSGTQYQKVRIEDILIVEADKVYLHIHTRQEKRYTVSIPLAQFERSYHFPDLLRVSRSHFINVSHIDYFEEPATLVVGGIAVNVGKTYRKMIKQLLPFLRTK